MIAEEARKLGRAWFVDETSYEPLLLDVLPDPVRGSELSVYTPAPYGKTVVHAGRLHGTLLEAEAAVLENARRDEAVAIQRLADARAAIHRLTASEADSEFRPLDSECCMKYLNGRPRMTLIVCPTCGNKRCPKATDHNLACSGSNEEGQVGSWAGPPIPDPEAISFDPDPQDDDTADVPAEMGKV